MDPGDLPIGTVLRGKWRLDALIGRGGMATVYAATHRNGKRVAVKVLNADLSCHLGVRERFVREGYLANKVGRGAVTVDDDDETDDGAPFLVMELLDGETLEARRERKPGGRLPAAEVAGAMDQVLGTLAAAHAQGIVHRDLKPENMFLTRDGVVKLLDFGIARLRESTGAEKNTTASGTLMGTAAYMSPEQARGRWAEVDARSDLWAVGATMFALLAGRCVHESETIPELLVQAITAPAPALRSVAREVPRELAAIVDRALLREKEARWQDATSLQTALREAFATWSARGDEGPPSDEERTALCDASGRPLTPESPPPRVAEAVSAPVATAPAAPTLASAAPAHHAPQPSHQTTAPVSSGTPQPKRRSDAPAWLVPSLALAVGFVGIGVWLGWPAPSAEVAPAATAEPTSPASAGVGGEPAPTAIATAPIVLPQAEPAPSATVAPMVRPPPPVPPKARPSGAEPPKPGLPKPDPVKPGPSKPKPKDAWLENPN